MKVIAIANTKGGSGKSTLSCCLAAELVHRGQRVTLIDADPQGGTRAWHEAGGPLHNIPLIVEPGLGVTQAAKIAAAESVVLIDAAGARTKTLVGVLEAADLVLIPCRASALDAHRAVETAKEAHDVAKDRGKRVPVYIVLNAVLHAAAITPHIRSELEAAKVKVTKTEIGQRTAFAVAAINGSAPCWMGWTATQAAEEIAALADELEL
jgi:chromosome partitioning protein